MATYQNPTDFNAPSYSGPGNQYNIPSLNNPFNYGQQRTENADWLSGYTQTIGNQPTYTKLTDQYANKYMIPQLTEQVQSYDTLAAQYANQLAAMPKNVAATTTESLVSDPQRQRIVEARSEPIQQALSTVGNLGQAARSGLQSAQSQQAGAVSAEMAQLEKELMPWEKQYDLMNVMQAREFTGWNSEMERELNTLLSNQQSGLTWTNAEAQRANALQQIKEQYAGQLNLLEKQGEQQAKFFSYLS